MQSRRSVQMRNEFRPRSFRSSLGRIGMVAAGPFVAAFLLFVQAAQYFQTIPAGDMSFRLAVFGLCAALGVGLLVLAAAILVANRDRIIHVESRRLVIRESSAMVSADWGGVTMSPPQRRLGVRHAVVCVNGRTRTVDDLFFPHFDELCSTIAERVRTFDRSAHQTVSIDLVQAV